MDIVKKLSFFYYLPFRYTAVPLHKTKVVRRKSIIGKSGNDHYHLESSVRLERVPPVLRGDRLRLGQILLNLVGNAVKFTETGMIEIAARVVGEDGDFVTLRFEVRDKCIGMNAEQIERLFQSFEQADESMTRRFGGTGLGLAISKRLVEMMNGTVGVESQPGVGSLFWLDVPLQKSSKFELGEGLSRLKGMRTLIVDDLEVAHESLCAIASELSLPPDAVGSGEAALKAVLQAEQEGVPYRLMIIDWKRTSPHIVPPSEEKSREPERRVRNSSMSSRLLRTARGRRVSFWLRHPDKAPFSGFSP